MKKCISLCLLLALFTAFTPAYADILWTPDDSFYNAHAEECVHQDRAYFANGPEGSVILYSSPVSGIPVVEAENGERLWISVLYQDWGCATLAEQSGWIPLDQLVPVYDHISFEEEYGDQFRAYAGEFTGYSGPAVGVAFWAYPGAPEPEMVWSGDDEILAPLTQPNAFSYVFTDEEGRLWGFGNYLYGLRDFWFCFDEPTKTDFPIREIPDYNLIPAKKIWLPAEMRLPALLTVGVVGVTAGLLYGFRRAKRKR